MMEKLLHRYALENKSKHDVLMDIDFMVSVYPHIGSVQDEKAMWEVECGHAW